MDTRTGLGDDGGSGEKWCQYVHVQHVSTWYTGTVRLATTAKEDFNALDSITWGFSQDAFRAEIIDPSALLVTGCYAKPLTIFFLFATNRRW